MDAIAGDELPCRDATSFMKDGSVSIDQDEPLAQLEEKLQGYFAPTDGAATEGLASKFSDADIHHISEILKLVSPAWSKAPRLYIVMRHIGHLDSMDTLIAEGVTDLWFPFTSVSIPRAIDGFIRKDILDNQWVVLTKAVDLENSDSPVHHYFDSNEFLPYESTGHIGQGSFGKVDKVVSLLSRKEFARKQILRGPMFKHVKKTMSQFEGELAALKRLRHHHIVKLVASYTDPKYVGLFFYPVADANLAQFFDLTRDQPEKRPLLRRFFGCLAGGLAYIHENSIRHKDIKPENILIKGDTVLITDFGIALTWDEFGHSTTHDAFPMMTRRYSSPELLLDAPRNSSADIWALGCVFLEMISVIKGRTVTELWSFLEGFGTQSVAYALNLDGVQTWMDMMGLEGERGPGNRPLEWAQSMLREKGASRPTAQLLFNTIRTTGASTDPLKAFACLACVANSASTTVVELKLPKLVNPRNKMALPIRPQALARALEGRAALLIPTGSQNLSKVSLFAAIRDKDLAKVELLIEQGVDIESEDYSGRRAIHKAAADGLLPILTLLIKRGAKLDAQDNEGMTPLHLAAVYGFDSIVKELVDHGAEMEVRRHGLMTPLHVAANHKHTKCAKILIDAGADIHSRTDQNSTPLVYCAQYGDPGTAKLLLDAGADPNTIIQMGRTVVHHAAQWGQDEVLALLLDRGSDIDSQADDLASPLILAVHNDRLACTKLLLERGADTALGTEDSRSALHWAAGESRLEHVRALARYGANLEAQDYQGSTPLILAAGYGHEETVQQLLDYGADIEGRDYGLGTALIHAAMNGRAAMVALLIENGAKVDARSKFGGTALHSAAGEGHADAAAVLVSHGASLNVMNRYGATPLALAIGNGQEEVAQILLLAQEMMSSQEAEAKAENK